MKNHSRQREAILDILKKSYSHPTADEIFNNVKEELPSISLGTVYRNLDELVKRGIIKKIATTGKDKFDYMKSNHCHAICSECGHVHDIELNFNTNEMIDEIFSQSKIVSNPKDIIIIGTCTDCQKNKLGEKLYENC